MKLICIFALFSLGVIVRGNLITLAQPALLALGTLFAFLNQDALDHQPIEWSNILHFDWKDFDLKENEGKKRSEVSKEFLERKRKAFEESLKADEEYYGPIVEELERR